MKKTYKYILSFILVFSSFFFIQSVHALSEAKLCIYDYKNNDDNVHILVYDDGSATIAHVKDSEKGDLYNWNTAKLDGFVAKDYFLNNKYNCPKYAAVMPVVGGNDICMANEQSTIDAIKKKNPLSTICELKGQALLPGATDSMKKETSSYTFTLPKQCLCETNSSIEGSHAEKTFTLGFTVDNYLSRPSVSIDYGHKTNSENLHNWFPYTFGNLGNYVYTNDIIKTNSCPQYVVYDSKGNEWVALSDEANKDKIYKEADKGVIAACHEVSNSTTSNSNSNSNTRYTPSSNVKSNTNSNSSSSYKPSSNSKSNSDDDEDQNADFMVVTKYKKCGGSGNELITNIPSIVPRITSSFYNAIMVLVPVILIIMGTIDLVKGIMSQKEDEMKKGRETFVKRLVGSVIIFLIVLIVKFFVGAVARDNGNRMRIVDCIDCFVSNSCDTM